MQKRQDTNGEEEVEGQAEAQSEKERRKKTLFNDSDRASLAVRVIALFCLSQLTASGSLLLLFLNTCQATIILQHCNSRTLSSWLIIHKHTPTTYTHKQRLHIQHQKTQPGLNYKKKKNSTLSVKFLLVTSPLSLYIPFIFPFNMAVRGRGPVSLTDSICDDKDGQTFLAQTTSWGHGAKSGMTQWNWMVLLWVGLRSED